MKPIFSSEKIKEADAYTIAHEPIASIDLMERAAGKCFGFLVDHFDHGKRFMVFCGPGNNGGDGLAIARMLLESRFQCEVFIIDAVKKSKDFIVNAKRLAQNYSGSLHIIKSGSDIPMLRSNDVIIDCIFGTGLSKPPAGLMAECINAINNSDAVIVAIDLPSGLFADETSVAHKNVIVNARHTLTFQLMKLAFMFPENAKHYGRVHLLDIGLDPAFILSQPALNYLITASDVSAMIKQRKPFSHKGNFGHALIIAGSYGKTGAAVLSSKACLRSGAGLVSANVPGCGYQVLQVSVNEVMTVTDKNENYITELAELSKYNAVGIGPGIGTNSETQHVVKQLIHDYRGPVVFDADAINIISENKTWLGFLPPGCIFTPHVREFERIAGKSSNDFERNKLQVNFAVKHNCYVMLKGKYTCIATPEGKCFFNPTGNPGLSTGGSGDVLTGIITGLLAQGYSPFDAAMTGVYLHGLSGDLALEKQSYESLIAGDIIEYLGRAFKEVMETGF